jgi:transposase-like protein
MKQNRLLTDASQLFCQNEACPARGQVGAKTIVRYGQKRERYQCKVCQKTFSARQGTMFEELRKPVELIVIVVTRLSYGCPLQAIVHAYDLDERTVARGPKQAGNHCQKVHEERVMQKHLDLQHVQADEIRVKACRKIPWIAMALQIKTRLWLGGVVSEHRNRLLADALFHLVKQCCLPLQELLVVTDGWAAYPKSIRRVFREKALRQARQGRCRLLAWPGLLIGTVIKRTECKHVVEVVRRMAQGLEERALQLLASTQGGNVLNTSFIERINGTFRERLASLTRRCRHASHSVEMLAAGMWLVGCTYNFCWPHHELSRQRKQNLTPAMASGLTDHPWSVRELLAHRIAPPPWQPAICGEGSLRNLVVLVRLLRSSGRLACSA